jgi:hypothetical protein
MSETFQLILGFIFLIAVFLLTRWLMVLKIRSTCNTMVKELENLGAISPDTAVTLPYDRTQPFKIGGRDYKPKALESLVQSHIVIKTDDGKYYLANR